MPTESSIYYPGVTSGDGGGGERGEFTPGQISGLTWVNQGGAGIVLERGVAILTVPTLGSNSIRQAEQAISGDSGDWRVRCRLWIGGPDTAGVAQGLTLRESGTGKLVTFFVVKSGGAPANGLYVWRWTDQATFSTQVAALDLTTFQNLLTPVLLEITRVSGTISYRWSKGLLGRTTQIASEASTASFTTRPDRFGIGGNGAGAIDSIGMYQFMEQVA